MKLANKNNIVEKVLQNIEKILVENECSLAVNNRGGIDITFKDRTYEIIDVDELPRQLSSERLKLYEYLWE